MLYANRYRIQQTLGSGGMGTVYIAEDRFSQELIALKQITVDNHNLQFTTHTDGSDDRLALAQEFRLLASLQHPYIISVYDYGFDASGYPFYTMKLLRNAKPLLNAAKDYTRDKKLYLLACVAQALHYLHRRGVLHRDLSPNNVLVTGDNQVMLLDFGLAVTVEAQQQVGFGGTLPYIAPEVLQGDEPGPASDLYGLGILAYQLFADTHPFYAENTDELMLNVLTTNPDLSPIPETERGIISRLLEKDPQQRYASAARLLEVLGNHAPETITIRESFLRAAEFVGREDEMSSLLTALESATNGMGSAWLIAGESGIGKSRLLDEVRTHGLVSGALVLRGQAESEGGLPYQLWRDITRRLVLMVELSDTEASILKTLVPDLSDLLGRTISDIPTLEGPAQQQRLIFTLGSLFERVTQPVLLLLEDIHWSSESLEPLKQLVRSTSRLPLVIFATFRDDERPALPDLLPEMTVLKLERLARDAVYKLCQSMLGDVGQRIDLLELIENESEGNVFFIVEIVRFLANEVGRLTDISHMSLPERVFPDGMRQLMMQRLHQVSEPDQHLLKLAAVLGRQIDLRILQHAMHGSVDLEAWTMRCASVAVFEIREGQWQFAHDKLREALLNAVPDAEKAVYHRYIAEGIEAVHPHDAAFAFTLAQHWRQAGVKEKEAHYTNQAAMQSKEAGNLEQAIALYLRTLELESDTVIDKATALQGLSGVYRQLGAFNEAESIAQDAIKEARIAQSKEAEAAALLLLADSLRTSGKYHEAFPLFDQCLQVARSINDEKVVVRALNGLGLCTIKTGHPDEARQYWQDAIKAHQRLDDKAGMAKNLNGLAILSWNEGDFFAAEGFLQQSLVLWRQIGDQLGIANQLDNLGAVAGTQGHLDHACEYLEECLTIRRKLGNLPGIANVLNNLANVFMDKNDFTTAQAYVDEALEIRRKTNDVGGIINSLAVLGQICDALGDKDSALSAFKEGIALGREHNHRLGLARHFVQRAFLWLNSDHFESAVSDFREAIQHAKAINAKPLILESLCGYAHLAFIRGKFETSAELVGVIQQHLSSATLRVKTHLDVLMSDLQTVFSQEALNAHIRSASAKDFDQIVASTVNKFA